MNDREDSLIRRPPPALWAQLKPLTREYRRNPTEAERLLWHALRTERLSGFKARRQHAIGRFIVDFYCAKADLIVEVDGPIHEQQIAEDEQRTRLLQDLGCRVLRFDNNQLLKDIDEVVGIIKTALG